MSNETENLIAQLQARLDALEKQTAEGSTDTLSIQRDIVALNKAKQIAWLNSLKKDIRPQLARGYGYNPDMDLPSDVRKPYPTFVYLKQPDGTTKAVIANNKYEHDKLIGAEESPAQSVSVDISALGKPEPVQVAKPRGRPKKAPVELPPNLE